MRPEITFISRIISSTECIELTTLWDRCPQRSRVRVVPVMLREFYWTRRTIICTFHSVPNLPCTPFDGSALAGTSLGHRIRLGKIDNRRGCRGSCLSMQKYASDFVGNGGGVDFGNCSSSSTIATDWGAALNCTAASVPEKFLNYI